ncbi:zinc-finger homeodomain protein 5 [Phtheirospermum japonicum]|uniref:Zinc-finger homeodomain protein 5 n=1 Tax=Phtheirospermum japonicum TaxID=374723 RepID=A0A830BI14_9LAMI|nr:zinc-finger homeodomain protein 5 [Phtheirospermum japonicum]
MPQKPRGEHGGPRRGCMCGTHAQRRGRHTGNARCAACDCHRNFHCKKGDGEPTLMQQPISTPAPTIAATAVCSHSTAILLQHPRQRRLKVEFYCLLACYHCGKSPFVATECRRCLVSSSGCCRL